MTELIHGNDSVKIAKSNTSSFFQFDFASLENMSLQEFESHFEHTEKSRFNEDVKDFSSLLTDLKLRKTKADARRVMSQNGLQVNGTVMPENREIDMDQDFLFGKYLIVKCGKK